MDEWVGGWLGVGGWAGGWVGGLVGGWVCHTLYLMGVPAELADAAVLHYPIGPRRTLLRKAIWYLLFHQYVTSPLDCE